MLDEQKADALAEALVAYSVGSKAVSMAVMKVESRVAYSVGSKVVL